MMYYLVYRVYTKDERPLLKDRAIFYGWSENKFAVKAFLKQRNRKKYKVITITDEDPKWKKLPDDVGDDNKMLDFVNLRSSKTKELIKFFTTVDEMRETEIKIQRLFHEASSLAEIKGDTDTLVYMNMIANMKEYFKSALFYLGYRPQEFDALYDSSDSNDKFNDLDKVEDEIDSAYENVYLMKYNVARYKDVNYQKPFGLNNIEDVASRIIYSLESFVKVLREEM